MTQRFARPYASPEFKRVSLFAPGAVRKRIGGFDLYLANNFVGNNLARLKAEGKKIVSITAYDHFTATLALAADADFILVGDSLGNVVQGRETTIPVTLEEIVYHTKIVVRTVEGRIPVFADMPFGSFKIDALETVRNAVRVFKETGCAGVKLEGATEDNLAAVRKLTDIGVSVMGHTGFLPQTVFVSGGYRYRGKTESDSTAIIREAAELANAGACAVVLELVKSAIAEQISAFISPPTIGIGSGSRCDGQILVIHDILGMFPDPPSFVTPYASFLEDGTRALREWSGDVRNGDYPRRRPKPAAKQAVREEQKS